MKVWTMMSGLNGYLNEPIFSSLEVARIYLKKDICVPEGYELQFQPGYKGCIDICYVNKTSGSITPMYRLEEYELI